MATDLSAWDEVQLDRPSEPPQDFSDLSVAEAVELIKEWFLENFEDPAEMTPYESQEGGYQWIWGGPYDARDVIGNVFADSASEEIIEAAIDAVQAGGLYDWAPHRNRIQPPDDQSDDSLSSGPEELHAKMLQSIEKLEEVLTQIADPPAGIGHNNPPEAIDFQPLSPEEWWHVKNAITVLKSQSAVPESKPEKAVHAAGVLVTLGNKVSEYFDIYFSEFAKSAGAESGKWAIRLPVWASIGALLSAAGTAALHWLHTLPWPF